MKFNEYANSRKDLQKNLYVYVKCSECGKLTQLRLDLAQDKDLENFVCNSCIHSKNAKKYLHTKEADDECETTDEIQLAKANPALGHGLLTMRALLANQNTMPENQFRSEVLCQTVDSLLPEPFPKGAWDELLDPISTIPLTNDVVYGIDMSADRKNVSIAVCGKREDGNWHIEMITKRNGVQWAIDWFRERAVKGKMKLAFQGRGAPVCSLAEEICTLAGIERCPVEGNVLADGWTRFYDCIATPEGTKIYHLDQPILNHCAKIMQLKKFGTGLTLPDRVKSPDDISPLFACIMAYSIASQTQQKQERNEKRGK